MTASGSREEILGRIRRRTIGESPLPTLSGDWIAFPNRERQFIDVLTSVGGVAHRLDHRAALEPTIKNLDCFPSAKKIVCTVPGLELGNCDLQTVADPHKLEDVDVAILPGQFGVAENGAVWVTDKGIRHRAIYFITQHLILVVPRTEILDTLHQAYERISFEGAGYGLFISGPSKTADIEQSLVIGAHGPRSLTVLLAGA